MAVRREADACTRCHRRLPQPVPWNDPRNGGLDALVMCVLEAPGLHGACLTGQVSPDNDDATARHFRALVPLLRIPRRAIYMTNAVLHCMCAAPGRMAIPHPSEIANCAPFLLRQIDAVQPWLVIAVGRTALRALDCGAPLPWARRPLHTCVGRVRRWYGRFVTPLFHPSQRVLNSGQRTWEQQERDWRRVGRLLTRLLQLEMTHATA